MDITGFIKEKLISRVVVACTNSVAQDGHGRSAYTGGQRHSGEGPIPITHS